jgi:Na+/proline symporter
VGLATFVLYPDLPEADKKLGYVMAIRDYLPGGLKGLLVMALLAAYMSTVSTQLNWGASYIVNDFYKRFIKLPGKTPQEQEKHLVLISRVVTLLIMVISLYVTTMITSISKVWQFLLECGAGLGLVLILRWYWWRVNAWSEISATIAPFIGYAMARTVFHWVFPTSFFFTVGFTTLTWVIVTFSTRPTSQATLENFIKRVQPLGKWKKIYQSAGITPPRNKLKYLFINWFSSIAMTYSVLFASGKFIFQEWNKAFLWLGTAIVSFIVLYKSMNKQETIQ